MIMDSVSDQHSQFVILYTSFVNSLVDYVIWESITGSNSHYSELVILFWTSVLNTFFQSFPV